MICHWTLLWHGGPGDLSPFLIGANVCFATSSGYLSNGDEAMFGVQKASLNMFLEYSPSSVNLASDWLRAKRALLWMRKK